MSDARAPVLRLAVFLAIFSLIALALVAGCKKEPQAESKRLTLGGADALEDEGGETAAAQGAEVGEAAPEATAAGGGGRRGSAAVDMAASTAAPGGGRQGGAGGGGAGGGGGGGGGGGAALLL